MALLLAALLGSQAANATAAGECRLPGDVPAAPVLSEPASVVPVHDLQMVYTWSPYHCKRTAAQLGEPSPAGPEGAAAWDFGFQCEQNRFAFVVHGLWPQAEGKVGREGQPRACKAASPLEPRLLRRHLCTVPGVRLMQNEWYAHGTCHWSAPEAYFAAIERLADSYPMPRLAALQDRDVSVDDVVAAVVAHNDGKLAAETIGVRTQLMDGRRTLQEVFICLDLHEQPKACPHRGTPGKLKVFVLPVAPSGTAIGLSSARPAEGR